MSFFPPGPTGNRLPTRISVTGEPPVAPAGPARRRRGFALLEALVCLLLSLCLAWGLLPRYFSHRRQRDIDHASLLVRQKITLARQQAITTRRRHQLLLAPGENTLAVYDFERGDRLGEVTELPAEVIISEVTDTLQPLVFRPSGGLAGVSGSIVLEDRRSGRRRRLVVYAVTGQVRPAAD